MGQLEMLVLTFPGAQPRGKLRNLLDEVAARPDLNVVDGAVVRRYPDGTVDTLPLAELATGDGPRYPRTRLLAEEDLAEVAGLVPDPDTSGLAVLVEHTWPHDIASSVQAAGGALAATVAIPGDLASMLV